MAQNPYALPDQDELDRNRAMEFGRLSPLDQYAVRRAEAQQGMERAATNIGLAAFGQQSPEQRKRAAVMEIQALARTVRPGTPEFYDKAAAIFQKHGLVDEAEQIMARKMAGAQASAELEKTQFGGKDNVLGLQQRLEMLLKMKAEGKPVDDAIAAVKRQLALIGTRKEGTSSAPPELIKYQEKRDEARAAAAKARAAGDEATAAKFDAQAKEIQGYINAIVQSKRDAGAAQRTAEQRAGVAASRESRIDRKEKEKSEADKEVRKKALTTAVQQIGIDIVKAKNLLKHPDLPGLIGYLVGSTEGGQKAYAAVTRNDAYPLYIALRAQTFLNALQTLKAQSRAGNTGLGQLTEVEGAKIQEAQAALNPQSGLEAFKANLKDYIRQLEATRRQGVADLTAAGLPVPALVVPERDYSRRVPTTPPGAPQPSTQKPAPEKEPVFHSRRREG